MNNKEAKQVLYAYRPNRPQKPEKRRLQQAIDKAVSTMDAFDNIVTSTRIDIKSKWRKDKNTLRCTNCGFGYTPDEAFYMNGTILESQRFVFKYCPNCGEKMGNMED